VPLLVLLRGGIRSRGPDLLPGRNSEVRRRNPLPEIHREIDVTTGSARGRTALVAGVLLALAVVAAPAAWASSGRVDVERGAYDGRDSTWYYTPEEVRVSPGGSVTWHNPVRHGLTAAADDHPTACVRETRRGRTNGECPWRSFDLPPGSSHTVSFPEEGTFQYVCALHSWMVGTVVVGSGVPPADEPEPEPEPDEEAEQAPEPESEPDPEPAPESETATDADDTSDDEHANSPADGSEDDEAQADDHAVDDDQDSEADDEQHALASPPTPEPDEQLDAIAARDDTGASGPLALVALVLLALALGGHGLVRRRHA
jgi:plastocyanin